MVKEDKIKEVQNNALNKGVGLKHLTVEQAKGIIQRSEEIKQDPVKPKVKQEKKRKLRRIARHSIAEVYEYIDASPNNGQQISFYGDKMHVRSSRLMNFRAHGIECVECGIRGAYFAKEKWGDDPAHLNLYGFDKSGKSVLMTQDHIKPKARGGVNYLYNLQPMCVKCNSKKGCGWEVKYRFKYLFRKMKHWLKKDY